VNADRVRGLHRRIGLRRRLRTPSRVFIPLRMVGNVLACLIFLALAIFFMPLIVVWLAEAIFGPGTLP